MRWLCDENIPRILVEELRQRGHDAAWIMERASGVSDADVLTLAVREHRLCLTFDKDFGELAYPRGLSSDCGIIPFPPYPPNS